MTLSLLTVPGYENSGPQHWQSLWEQKSPEYRRVMQRDWNHPVASEWVETLDNAIAEAEDSIVLVAHSLGCITVVRWASLHCRLNVRAALLAAPADVERADIPPVLTNFRPIYLQQLPFSSIVVASSNDPYLSLDRASLFAEAWGSKLVNVGSCGHMNSASGLGDWPAGEELLERLKRQIYG